MITKNQKTIIDEDNIVPCTNEERDLFMCIILSREALLSALPKNEYSQVKYLKTSYEIWLALQSNFEGDEHAKKFILHNWICAFEDIIMMEDESVRSYIGRMSKIVIDIKSCGGTKTKNELIWKILRTLTHAFKKITQMIEQVIPCTINFTRETLLGRLEVSEMNLRLSRDLPRMETAFSALSVHPTFSRSISVSGDYASSNRSRNEEDRKIELGISLLVKREPDGKKIFKCWTC